MRPFFIGDYMTKATPHYYKDFRCIAERCHHNCCIGWEIDIDKITYKKYRKMKDIRPSTFRDLRGAHFKTDERGRCVELSAEGRCKIIERYGEDALCDICRLHPRFINRVGDREEIGLGLCCEEAARIIITDERPLFIENDGEDSFCLFRRRAFDTEPDRLLSLIGSEWTRHPLSFWKNVFLSLERLDEGWTSLLSTLDTEERDVPEREREFKNIQNYFIFRHLRGDSLEKELFFCYLSYYIIRELYKRSDGSLSALIDISRQYSAEVEYSDRNRRSLFDLG